MNTGLKEKPDMSFWGLWNLSFGFFGVQIAYALQSANISRIFATLGADPHSLSYFWILPPLMGILVQPIVGSCSDKTWCRFGRRIPYLFIGAAVAVLVMCLLPNSGSFGMAVSTAMVFGLLALMFLDTSINMAMQPFKMLVGDMVNEKQKAQAYSIQSFLCNAGSLVGYVFPFAFAAIGIANTAPKGTIPDSVIYSFYVGAAILILCVIYTVWKVKEWPPKEYQAYNGSKEEIAAKEEGSSNWFVLLKNAPSTFWKVGLVQFFCWFAFMYMWTYTNGTVAANCWGTTDVTSAGYQEAGNWVGILFAVQAIGSVIWAPILPKFKNRKLAYAASLVLGGIGFVACAFIHDQYLLFVPFLLIGCAWAAMLAMPFTFVTNALQGYGHMGAYLGLFNGTICIPQIVAAAVGGVLLALAGSVQSHMMIIAGISLVLGALAVKAIKED
ncbi:sugar transporter [Hallella multisaccharivorax DSM 17128]|uniref:Major facilitator superfamily MFS_1 n=1 Tax=Hallella multisaccharivorax DSM 17128 TaxID=688246 RepID=F8N6W5_9BACT|nr:SLC45 family MFS transporter [Hallella multisaccharivorax]EGN57350.1 major facilitator superfamily MFS_1 [Hallella multisaccharivorax DSM 17128]GJG31411.1 sugar transporter [Hallella multisaccharivorax DSM 17128]